MSTRGYDIECMDRVFLLGQGGQRLHCCGRPGPLARTRCATDCLPGHARRLAHGCRIRDVPRAGVAGRRHRPRRFSVASASLVARPPGAVCRFGTVLFCGSLYTLALARAPPGWGPSPRSAGWRFCSAGWRWPSASGNAERACYSGESSNQHGAAAIGAAGRSRWAFRTLSPERPHINGRAETCVAKRGAAPRARRAAVLRHAHLAGARFRPALAGSGCLSFVF